MANQMAYQYKAFISYRHAPLDMKVAVEIQNRLERYRIPGSIRKELGIKSIGRIFRDKDELPSTSDLNDNIKEAIASSEYLICICSPDYIESIWCRKELEFFLESHDKTHVLTVLADGDPAEVVPEILRTETVTTTDEDGNTVTSTAMLEPLSCDWRMDRHRARTEEFPRLAASLIGCRYADLRQKTRKRQMRLAAAAAAAGALLLAYFVWSYLGIQKNYRTSLINQSRYLSASAQEALNSNDDLLAAQLSLAALPSEKIDRPLIPEALFTLSKAVSAYKSKGLYDYRCTASYEVPGGNLDASVTSPDGSYLAMADLSGSVIAAWDLKEDTMTGQSSAEKLIGETYNIGFCGHSNEDFVIWNCLTRDVALVRYSDVSPVWHQNFESDGWVYALSSTGDEADSPLMLMTEKDLLFIDAATGEAFARISASDVSGGQAAIWYGKYYGYGQDDEGLYALCPEEGCVCVAAGKEYDSENKVSGTHPPVAGFFTYYYETGESVWTPFEKSFYRASGISRDSSGRILFTFADKAEDYAINTLKQNSDGYSQENFEGGKETVLLLQEGTGEILWKNELPYQGIRSLRREGMTQMETPYVFGELRTLGGRGDHPDRELAVVATSNAVRLFDTASGKIVKDLILPDEIVSVDPASDYAEGSLVLLNGSTGTQYYFTYYEDKYRANNITSDNIDDAIFYPEGMNDQDCSQFIIRQGSTVRVLKDKIGDDEWVAYDCTIPEEYEEYAICGSILILLDEENRLYAYDLTTGTDLWQKEIEKGYQIRGISQNSTYLFLRRWESPCYLRVKIADGTAEQVSIVDSEDLTGAGRWDFDDDSGDVRGDFIFYRVTNYNNDRSFWFRYSMEDGSIKHVTMPYYTDSARVDSRARVFTKDGRFGFILHESIGYLADFEKGSVTQLEDPFPEMSKWCISDDGKMIACWGYEERILRVYTTDGKLAWENADLRDEYFDRLWFYKDDLFAGAESNHLYRFRASDGKPYKVLNASFTIQPDTNSNGWIETGDGCAILDSAGGQLLMVDLDNWAVTAEAKDVLGYCAETGQIISISVDDPPALGACPYYSPQQLIEKGKRFVGDHTLTEDEKVRYGLE